MLCQISIRVNSLIGLLSMNKIMVNGSTAGVLLLVILAASIYGLYKFRQIEKKYNIT